MTRLTMLFIAVALVLPGAALARPAIDRHGVDQAAATRKWSAVNDYYAAKAVPAPVEQPAASDGNGLSWSIAIGAGIALMLAAGGLGLYAGRTVRPRHIGA
jgi:hypothetical protein